MHKNNQIIIIKADGKRIKKRSVSKVKINFFGDNNLVEICEPFNISNFDMNLGSNVTIKIGKNCVIKGSCIKNNGSNSGANITIGENFYCNGMDIAPNKNGDITIGDNCLFSWGINLRSSPDHLIWDENQEKPRISDLNRPIIIGNHVWIGMNSTILKGAIVADNCVVAAGTIVTKKFTQEKCVIAGNPGKVVKTGILWES